MDEQTLIKAPQPKPILYLAVYKFGDRVFFTPGTTSCEICGEETKLYGKIERVIFCISGGTFYDVRMEESGFVEQEVPANSVRADIPEPSLTEPTPEPLKMTDIEALALSKDPLGKEAISSAQSEEPVAVIQPPIQPASVVADSLSPS